MTRKTTDLIEEWALRLGARMSNIYVWRIRGVPQTWKTVILTASKGRVTEDDFVFNKRKKVKHG
jgi:hypothetical protein